MADFEDSCTSSDEENECYERSQGLQGYQFEPRRTLGEASSSANESESDSTESETETEPREDHRMENLDWCTCGRCSNAWLGQPRECSCCQEGQGSRALASPSNADDTICVTNNGDFIILCKNEVVLANVLVSLNNVKGDDWQVNPPANRGLRYAAYRQYIWWAHGRLGRRRRRVIPACVTHAIREAFPKAENEQYEGFLSGEESD